MEYIQNEILDNTLLICGKDESHSKYLELLFENKKRSGGDEIEHFHYDNKLNQYLIIYKNNQTLENVMNHESISYNNELFIPFRVDKTKFIIENLDEKLEKDILNLYAENLIQDVQHFKCTVDYLCNNLFLVNCDKEIDFNKLKERFERHRTIKNKELTIHLVARINSSDVTYKHIEYKNLYFKTNEINLNRDSPTSSEGSNEISEINDEGFIEIYTGRRARQESIQTPVSFFIDVSNHTKKQLIDRIRELEDKLKNFDNLKATLIKIKILSQDCSNKLHENSSQEASAFSPINNLFQNRTSNIKTTTLIHDDIKPLKYTNSNQSSDIYGASSITSSTDRINDAQSRQTGLSNNNFDQNMFTPLNTRPKPIVENNPRLRPGILKETQIKPKSNLTNNNNNGSTRRNFFDSFDSNPASNQTNSKSHKEGNLSSRMAQLIVRTDSYYENKIGRGRGMLLNNNNNNKYQYPEADISLLRDTSDSPNRSSPPNPPFPSAKHGLSLNQRPFFKSLYSSPPSWALSSPSSSRSPSSTRSASPMPSIPHYRNDIFQNHNLNDLFMPNVTGLNEDLINRFPIIKYKKPKTVFKVNSLIDLNEATNENIESITCTICLDSLEDNVDVRILSCFHQFHVNCIDKWLKEKSVCPSCKMCLRKSLVNNDY